VTTPPRVQLSRPVRKVGINFLAFRPFNRVANRVFSNIVPLIPAVVDIRHRLNFFTVPAQTVSHGKGVGFAAFHIVRRVPEIVIADQKPERGMSDNDHAMFLIEHAAHELAHYEQWRDGRKLQERGVEVRARTIKAKLLAHLPTPAGAGAAEVRK
jgi:hypothetical protein